MPSDVIERPRPASAAARSTLVAPPGRRPPPSWSERCSPAASPGRATHPLDNVRGNAQMLLDRDPDKEFGLTRAAGRDGPRARSSISSRGRPARRSIARRGPARSRSAPSRSSTRARAAGDRLRARVRARGAGRARDRPPDGPRAPVPRARRVADRTAARTSARRRRRPGGASQRLDHDWRSSTGTAW